MARLIPVLLCAFLVWTGPALSQSEEDSDPAVEEAKPEPIAPYDDKLLRLAEVLGSIHYLRNLCNAGEGSKWRDTMGRILEAEKPGPKRRAELIARFNRGYRAFDETHGSCSGSAIEAANRYVAEGALLAAQITTRYGR